MTSKLPSKERTPSNIDEYDQEQRRLEAKAAKLKDTDAEQLRQLFHDVAKADIEVFSLEKNALPRWAWWRRRRYELCISGSQRAMATALTASKLSIISLLESTPVGTEQKHIIAAERQAKIVAARTRKDSPQGVDTKRVFDQLAPETETGQVELDGMDLQHPEGLSAPSLNQNEQQ